MTNPQSQPATLTLKSARCGGGDFGVVQVADWFGSEGFVLLKVRVAGCDCGLVICKRGSAKSPIPKVSSPTSSALVKSLVPKVSSPTSSTPVKSPIPKASSPTSSPGKSPVPKAMSPPSSTPVKLPVPKPTSPLSAPVIFEPFGPVEVVQLPLDLETGHCKGFGFVQFTHLEHAKAAQSLNGKLKIAGRTIKVSCVTDHVGSQDTTAKSADLDDDEGGLRLAGANISASMGMPVVNGSVPAQQAVSLPIGAPVLPAQVMPTPMVEPVGSPSECLLLKNMFDPTTESEPDFDIDIKEDVEEECSKYG
ncbi:hypothetical protein LR48_Vigan01g095100 [Vigna angularis]|uniref:RRM domain-containing protein n=1 Tax=Phaseolus angularis TaxID=3914 RepID=A0A0L9TLN5_PHAAN|nr:hypothetical protein LR48_Vigan01g095100 [Vigna angularis]